LSGLDVTLGQEILAVVIAAGELTYLPTANGVGSPYDSLQFRVHDGGMYSVANYVWAVDVLRINDAPTGTDATVTAGRNGTYVFSPEDFGFQDPLDAPPNSLAAVLVTTVPAAGVLTHGGVPVSAGQMIPRGDIAAGQLRFTPETDAVGTGYARFLFQVMDDGGTADGGVDLDPVPNSLTLDVLPPGPSPIPTAEEMRGPQAQEWTMGTEAAGASRGDTAWASARDHGPAGPWWQDRVPRWIIDRVSRPRDLWLSQEVHSPDVESLATSLLGDGASSLLPAGNPVVDRHMAPVERHSAELPAPRTSPETPELDITALWERLDVMVDDAHPEAGRLSLHVGTALALISVISVGYVVAHLRQDDWSADEN
jgi:hypothetical protein